MPGFTRFAAASAIAFVFLSTPARADAIDGHWCFKDGRRMHIDGPRIVLPSGKRINGDYDRHAFAYVVPPGDRGAGGTVKMALQSDYHLQVTPAGGGSEMWERCKKGVS